MPHILLRFGATFLFYLSLPLHGVAAPQIFAASASAPASQAAIPTYSPQTLKSWVSNAIATPQRLPINGPDRSPDVRSFIWKESSRHQVYAILRGNTSFGEFRDEKLNADGRVLEATDYYLANFSRRSQPQNEFPDLHFIRKTERFTWDNDQVVTSTVEWQFSSRAKDGTLLKTDPPLTVKMIKRHVTIEVPVALRPGPEAYAVYVKRAKGTDYERAYGEQIDDEGSLHVAPSRITADVDGELHDGKVTLPLEVPVEQPALVVELWELVLNSPKYALRYAPRKVATMKLPSLSNTGVTLVFKP